MQVHWQRSWETFFAFSATKEYGQKLKSIIACPYYEQDRLTDKAIVPSSKKLINIPLDEIENIPDILGTWSHATKC